LSKQPITLAFAGSADTDPENVKALLNDWLGFGDEDGDGFFEPSDREINLIFPITREHLSDGLETVLAWAEKADLPYVAVADNKRSRATEGILKDAEEVVHASNVTAGVVDLLKKADSIGDEVHVILLWGDEGSEQAELLLDAAEQAGIKAKDLTAGLDDISFGEQPQAEEPEEEPEPEPEPEPEAPKRGRRRGRRSEPEEVEPEEEPLTEEEPEEPKQEEPKRGRRSRKADPEPEADPVEQDIADQKDDEDLEQQVNRAAQKVQRETEPVSDKEIDLILIGNALEGAYNAFRLEDERNAVINQAEVRHRPLTDLLAKALNIVADAVHDREAEKPEQPEQPVAKAAEEKTEEPEEQSSGRRRRGRPRDESKTFAFLVDDEGNYSRRGRGRIPAGQTVVHLTRAEIEEKGLELDSE
jgi:outer membrane biosynthesis protein TonB